MKKLLARALGIGGIAAATLTGCERYRNAVDPCWPERYNFTARREVVEAFAPQVQNGHVLDQTVWNYMFNTGTDELNGTGMAKLNYIIRSRPQPDPYIFVQTAQDVLYDANQPDKLADTRRDLDQKRVAAIQRYLNAETVGRPMQFEFAVHDPYTVGMPASYAAGSLKMATTAATTGILGNLTGVDSGLGVPGAPGAPPPGVPGAPAAPAPGAAQSGGNTGGGSGGNSPRY
jgi:hypothetical protein